MLQAPSPPRSSVDESIGDGEKIGDERAPTLAVQLPAAAPATGQLLFEQTQEHAPTYPRTHAPYSTLPYPTIPLLYLQSVNTESVNTESVNSESVNTESVNSESVNTESVNTESVNIESVNSESVNIESVSSGRPAGIFGNIHT